MPLLKDTTLGIDFGTSNSAMAVRQGAGLARMIALEGSAHTLPTALFFNAEDHRTHFGRDAVGQYLAGTEGRLMRSLKSLLGSALLQDKTAVHNKMVSYQDIISLFLRMLVQRARDELGGMPARVVMGRPVHFVDGDADRDQQAEDALRQAALDAGFAEVSFQLEPIAAALDYEQRIAHESLVLVVASTSLPRWCWWWTLGVVPRTSQWCGWGRSAWRVPSVAVMCWPPPACTWVAPTLTGG
jgi:hypothetical chaperone protein